jgi:predicted Fe-Mo cluster-binding NifX family protein
VGDRNEKGTGPVRIAVTSTGQTVQSNVDQRFGRAAFFIIGDTETMDFSTFMNDRIAAEDEAGIGAAKAIAGAGVQSVLTGDCGPNAERILRDAGVRLYTSVTGTVQEAIELFRDNKLTEAGGPSVPTHFGEKGKSRAGMSNGTNA